MPEGTHITGIAWQRTATPGLTKHIPQWKLCVTCPPKMGGVKWKTRKKWDFNQQNANTDYKTESNMETEDQRKRFRSNRRWKERQTPKHPQQLESISDRTLQSLGQTQPNQSSGLEGRMAPPYKGEAEDLQGPCLFHNEGVTIPCVRNVSQHHLANNALKSLTIVWHDETCFVKQNRNPCLNWWTIVITTAPPAEATVPWKQKKKCQEELLSLSSGTEWLGSGTQKGPSLIFILYST